MQRLATPPMLVRIQPQPPFLRMNVSFQYEADIRVGHSERPLFSESGHRLAYLHMF